MSKKCQGEKVGVKALNEHAVSSVSVLKSRAPAQNRCAGAGGGKICGPRCYITVTPEVAADRKALLKKL